MLSMTGYGKGVVEADGRVASVELKSVNHRFLDIGFKFPRGFQFAEDAVRKTLSHYLKRGHVEVFLTYEDNRTDKLGVAVDVPLALQYYNASRTLVSLGYEDNFGAAEAMRIPELVKNVEDAGDEEYTVRLIAKATERAAEALVAMRRAEGEKLKADLYLKVDALSHLLELVKQRAPLVQADYREKLLARMQEVLAGTEPDEARLMNEVAFFADKCNIDEEITRFGGHLAHYGEILASAGPWGKRLDFLTQEANREVNTIGSKSNDQEITRLVLQMKNQIEMVREQVQNLE